MNSKLPFAAAVGVIIPFPGAIIGSIITKQNIGTWYDAKLRKPGFRPPNWAFKYVWTGLYGSMGYASYLIWKDGGGFFGKAQLPLMLYGTQLALNWAFTPIFFGKKNLKWALIDILAVDAGATATICSFYSINSTASYLLIPYLGWSLFASYLAYWIYKNNKDGKHLE